MATSTSFDPNNIYSWFQRALQFDGDGFLIGSITTFDDGRIFCTTLRNGVLISETASDPDDHTNWTSWTSAYDALSGQVETKSQEWDDGRHAVTSFVEGVRASRTLTDEDDNYNWSSKLQQFDSLGRLAFSSTIYDDGRSIETEFDAGVKTTRTITDNADTAKWDTKVYNWDPQTGLLESITTTMDDGREITRTPAAGPIDSTVVQEDVADIRPWDSRTTTYDEVGAKSGTVIVYDDGRVRTDTFQNGKRSNSSLTDEGDAKFWHTINRAFDDKGRVGRKEKVLDDGRVSTETWTDGVKTSKTTINEANSFGWTSKWFSYDEGVIASKVTLKDDGTVITRQYADGLLQSVTRVDEEDAHGWETIERHFDPRNGAATYVFRLTDEGTKTFEDVRGLDVVSGGTSAVVEASSDMLTASNTITLVDGYRGATSFDGSASIAGLGGYGTFTLAADGTWSYTADASQTAIQALNTGETLTDSFIAVTVDGVETRVTATIEGLGNESEGEGNAPEGEGNPPVLADDGVQYLGEVGNLSDPPFVGRDLKALFTDEDGDTLTITATNLPSGVTLTNGVLSLGAGADLSTAGDHVISVTATDAANLSTTVNVTLSVALTHDFGDEFHASALDGETLEGSSGDDIIEFGDQVGSTASLEVNAGDGDDDVIFRSGAESWSDLTINGGAGDDVIAGGAGTNDLSGGDGFDTLSYAGAAAGVLVDLRTALDGMQDMQGASDDTIAGFEAVVGTDHDDTLIAGAGLRELTGGDGSDRFVLAGVADGALHLVSDFDASEDVIELDKTVFFAVATTGIPEGGAGEGPLIIGEGGDDPNGNPPGEDYDYGAYLVSNTSGVAETDETRVIYNSATGILSFDRDGTGDEEAVAIADIGAGLSVDESHFQFVDAYQRAPVAADLEITVSAGYNKLMEIPVGDLNPGDNLTFRFDRDATNFEGFPAILFNGYFQFVGGSGFDHLREGETTTQTMHYSVTDDFGNQDFGKIDLTVVGVENAPRVVRDTATGVYEDTDLVLFPLVNDYDIDGNSGPLRIVSVEPTEMGTTTISEDGQSITFTPAADRTGVTSLIYTIVDDTGLTDSGRIEFFIAPVNDAPDVFDISAAVDEDGSVVLDPDFFDRDSDSLSVTPNAGELAGSLSVQDDGTFLYTASGLDALTEGEVFTDRFTYTVRDTGGATTTAAAIITVTGRDDAPVTTADAFVAVEDHVAELDVLANDLDLDAGDTLTLTRLFNVDNGTAEIIDGAYIKFTPDWNFEGETRFDYEVTSSSGATAVEEVALDYTPVNDRPDTKQLITVDMAPRPYDSDTGGYPEGRTTIAFRDVIEDVDVGDVLSYRVRFMSSSNGGHQNGTITVVDDLGNGQGPGFHYDAPAVPQAYTFGTDVQERFLIEGVDQGNLAATSMLTVNIAGQEYAPRLSGYTYQTFDEGSDGGAMGLGIFDGNGSWSAFISGLRNLPENGSVSLSGDSRDVIYNPDDGFWGTDTFEIQLTDDTGLTSEWYEVSAFVQPVINDPTVELEITATDRFDQFIVTLTAHTNEDERLSFGYVDLTFEDSDGNALPDGLGSTGKFLAFDGDNGWGQGMVRQGNGHINKSGESVTTTEEYLVTVPEQYLDLFTSGELTVVGAASSALGQGFSTTRKQIAATTTEAQVNDTMTFQNASLWAPEDAGRHTLGYDIGGTFDFDRSFGETLFQFGQRAFGIGVTSHVSVEGGASGSVTAAVRPEVWIEGGSLDGGIGFDTTVNAIKIDTTGAFGFATSASVNAANSWFNAQGPNSGFDFSLSELSLTAEAFLRAYGYAHIHTGGSTHGPEPDVRLNIPEVSVDLAGGGASFVNYDGNQLSILNGLLSASGDSFAHTFRSPAQNNEMGYFGVQKPNLFVTSNDANFIDGFYNYDNRGHVGFDENARTVSGTNSVDFANLQLDIDGIAATLKGIKNPVDINEGFDAGVLTGDFRLEALDLDLRADISYMQSNSLEAQDVFGRIVLENGDEFDFKFGDTFSVGLIDDFDADGDGQVAYKVLTKATATVQTDADIQLSFYDYLAILDVNGGISTTGVVKKVLDEVGLPSSFSIGTNGPVYDSRGFIFYERESVDVADSSYLLETGWNDNDWAFV